MTLLRDLPAQKPSVSRAVHYKMTDAEADDYGASLGRTCAATIVFVHEDDRTSLFIMLPTGGHFGLRNVPFSETPAAGHWNWPPRVP